MKPWGDVLLAYVASLATGKSDFEAIRPWHGKTWVGKALRISTVASPETVRQHLDNLADGHSHEALENAGQASLDLLARANAPFTRCSAPASSTARRERPTFCAPQFAV